MKVQCKTCKETYPYEPAYCNECGMPYSITTFTDISAPVTYSLEKLRSVARAAFSYGFDEIDENEFNNWFKKQI